MKFSNRTTVRRVGGSLAVLLPLHILRVAKIDRGDQLAVHYTAQGSLTLTKVPREFKERMIRA